MTCNYFRYELSDGKKQRKLEIYGSLSFMFFLIKVRKNQLLRIIFEYIAVNLFFRVCSTFFRYWENNSGGLSVKTCGRVE